MEPYNDNEVQEVLDDISYNRQRRDSDVISKIKPANRKLLGFVIGGLIIAVATKYMQTKTALFIGVGVIIFTYFSNKDEDIYKRELTYIHGMAMLNQLLKFLQKNPIGDFPQIPPGKIELTPITNRQILDGKPNKRIYGVKIHDKRLGTVENYRVEIDVYTGDIIKFMRQPEGVWGDELKDIKLMPTPDMFYQKQREKYGGKK